MSVPCDPEVLFQGRYLRLLRRERWEYVSPADATGVVAVVALHDDERVVLVEQYREPAGGRVIELPAGLVGDHDDEETLLEAAKRELLEETGYTADHWTQLVTGLSSAGLTDETITIFCATGLTKTSEGGGVGSESITVHKVAIAELAKWLGEVGTCGKQFDLKLLAGIYAAVVAEGMIAR